MKHFCDRSCICPVHKTPLIYAERVRDHACPDSSCVFAKGMKYSRKTQVTNVYLPGDKE